MGFVKKKLMDCLGVLFLKFMNQDGVFKKISGLLGVVMPYVGLLCELLWKFMDLRVFFKEISVLLGGMHGKFENC